MLLQTLQRESLPNSEIFFYLQIKHYVTSLVRSTSDRTTLTSYERKFKGMVPLLYNQLVKGVSSPNHVYMSKWLSDLDNQIELKQQSQIWDTAKSFFQNAMALEFNCKLIYHWYLTPTRITKYTLGHMGACFQGCLDLRTNLHTWWTCPDITWWRLWT